MKNTTPPFSRNNKIVLGFKNMIGTAFQKANFKQFQIAVEKAVKHQLGDEDLIEFTNDWYIDYKAHWENDPVEFLKFHLLDASIDSHNYELKK